MEWDKMRSVVGAETSDQLLFGVLTRRRASHQPKTWTVAVAIDCFLKVFITRTFGNFRCSSVKTMRHTSERNGRFLMQLEYRYSVLSGVFCFLLIVATFASPVFATQQAEKDITRQELLNFDRFLDSHPAIDQDLKKNPALVNDAAYLSAHPELKEFLATHPGVREEIHENPKVFMNREQRFDRSGRDITRQELQNFDGFLDTHPNIEQDLKKNPKLLTDSNYLSAHPQLKQFLDTHPGVRAEASENPRIFMNREQAFDRSGRDITRQELQNLDNFLDAHPNIEQDLKKNPKLLNDATYLSVHPELKQFLDTHPGVRAEASENPRIFMNRERHFENSGRDIPVQEVKSFDDFMDKHSAIEGEVRRDPSLLNNADYLAKHPELKTYLDQHPRIRQELAENPRALIRAEKRFDKKEAKAERREERIERTETRRPLSR